jgi:hypothetical protein
MEQARVKYHWWRGASTSVADRRTLVIDAAAARRRHRSTLPKHDARRRYVESAELAVLQQIRDDAATLDREAIPVGPFARLDANLVAARDGKTRGAITNLFGSQTAFQAETMALALSARDWIERIDYPAPADYPTADAWLDALLAGESGRGPRRGAEPEVSYAFLWAIWLSAVPYGLWSERIARPSMDEHSQWIARLADVLARALEHFGLTVVVGTVTDLAEAIAGVVEGAWLNQCLTDRHPSDPDEPIATLVRRSGRLVWRGATTP